VATSGGETLSRPQQPPLRAARRRFIIECAFIQRRSAVPRSSKQIEQIRELSRERILRTALVLFARHGFARTSVRMLAEEAGISQGLLYNYFEGKQALLRAIFERQMEEVGDDFRAAARAGAPEDALAVLVRSAFETLRARPDFWRLSYQVRMQPEVLAELGDRVGEWAEVIRSGMENVFRLAGAPDAPVRARVLFAAIDGAAQHWVLDAEEYPLDAVANALIRLLVPLDASAAPTGPGRENER
jgi:AcrR family transcriptional regulator